MRVEIEYSPSTTVDLSTGRIEKPPVLSIELKWEDEPSDNDRVDVHVGRAVDAYLSVTTSRLLCIEGIASDLSAWRLAPAAVGDEIWQQVMQFLEMGNSGRTSTVEVSEASLASLQGVWRQLIAATQSGKIANMWGNREETRRILGILMSEPGVWRKMVDSVSELRTDK